MGKRIFALFNALVIIILFVGYLNDVKYSHDLLALVNLINIPIMIKFNKVNNSEDNNIMSKREVFFTFNTFALILLSGVYLIGVKDIVILLSLLIWLNILRILFYIILNKKNQKV